MRILQVPVIAFVYLSVATVIAEAAALAMIWARGGITREKAVQVLAVAHDVDLAAMWKTMEAKARPIEADQVSFGEVLEARAEDDADLDLREMATDKGLIDIGQLDSLLEQERERYFELKTSFERQLEQLRQGAVDTSLQEVQRQLESIDPRLAKDQILRILDDRAIDPETSMHFVVAMFKGMPLDKQKKIVAQFKNEEMERLEEILDQIRRGVPEVTLIRDTRRRLEEFDVENERRRTAVLTRSRDF